MDYKDFIIEIQSDSRTKSTFRGESKYSTLELSDSINGIIGTLADPTESNRFNRDQVSDFGQKLWSGLFRDEIKAQFEDAMKDVDNQHGLRILLEAAPNFADYPWETMFYNGTHLATDIKTPLLRIFPGDNRCRNLREKLPRILLILSNASGQFYVDTAKEKQVIEDSLEENQAIAKPLETVEIATIKRIGETLSSMARNDEPVNIIHFVGHGRFKDDTGFLALRKEAGGLEEAREDTIKQLFLNQVESLGLVILNACSTAKMSSQFSGLVPKLLSRVPAVVAMRQPISNPAAASFACGFYQNLLIDKIEVTVQNARNNMYLNNECRSIDFSIPVLYLGWRDSEGTARKIFTKDMYDGNKPQVPLETMRRKKPSEIVRSLVCLNSNCFLELKKKIDLITDPNSGVPLRVFASETHLWEYAIVELRKNSKEILGDVYEVFPDSAPSHFALSKICDSLFLTLDSLSSSIKKSSMDEIKQSWQKVNEEYDSLEGLIAQIVSGERGENS